MVGKETFARGTQSLSFTLDHGVQDKTIAAVLQKVYGLAGCRTCGLLGFDIHLHVINPAAREQFQEVAGVLDVNAVGGVR